MQTTADDRKLADLLPPDDQLRLTVREAAEMLGCPLSTMYFRINNGQLQSWRVAGRRYVTREGVERMLRDENPLADDQPRQRRSRGNKRLERRLAAANAEADARGV